MSSESEEVFKTGRTLEEPLAESAPLMHEMALRLCATDPRTGESCLPYHAVCQYLRHLDLMKTLSGRAGFFVDSFRGLARGGQHPRVLVSGAADYSMPAYVLASYETEQAVLDLSLVDRCETPLAITRWYAERMGSTVTTLHDNVLDLSGKGAYDVIVTSAFLGYFEDKDRPELFAKWAALLRPGGKLIFNQSVVTGELTEWTITAEESGLLRDRAKAELAGRDPIKGWDPAAIADLTAAYADWRHNTQIRKERIEELVTGGGFDLDQLESVLVAGRPGVSGPGTTGRSEGLQVIATRR